MQITSSRLTTEVCTLLQRSHLQQASLLSHIANRMLYLRHTCSFQVAHTRSSVYTDLNLHSMKLWGQYPDLAAFPGSLILDDDRAGDNAYPSSPLTPDQLEQEEPELSDAACQGGARLYKPEGMQQQLQTCCYARQHDALNASAAPIASPADWPLNRCAICTATATYMSFVTALSKMHFQIC